MCSIFRMKNDDVQEFDVRWDQALLSASEIHKDVILVRKAKLQDSVQLQTVLALYDQETVRKQWTTSYSRLKTSVRLHIDQTTRTRNYTVRNEAVEERSSDQESKKRKESLR